MTAPRLPLWMRVTLVISLGIFAIGTAFVGYRYLTRPITLTVAAGSIDGAATTLMSTLASRMALRNSHLRLKVIDTGTPLAASEALSSGRADLAVIRPDLGDVSSARAVLLLTHGVVLLVTPPGSSIESIEKLRNTMIGVVGGQVNQGIQQALARTYDLSRANVQFMDLALPDVQKALQTKKVTALLVVVPLTDKHLSMVRNFFERSAKRQPSIISIDSAEAIASIAKSYESFDLPKGALQGSPTIPNEDTTTLRVPYYLAAKKSLDDRTVSELARSILEARRDLLPEYPVLAQIISPGTDKDALIPVHPGAAAFFEGSEESLLDQYSNVVLYGPMLFGALASVLAAAWKFIGLSSDKEPTSPLDPLYELAGKVRHAQTPEDLSLVEESIDNIIKAELAKYAKGTIQAGDAAALSLAAYRLEHLINYRRGTLASRDGANLPTMISM